MRYPNGAGWVLQFSNQTFFEFFRDTINVNIDGQRWIENGGTSKGKRLRCFLRKAKDHDVLQVLEALWEIRDYELAKAAMEDPIPQANTRFEKILSRLRGEEIDTPKSSSHEITSWNDMVAARFNQELLDLSALNPHARGFAFEKFLNRVFAACNLSPREPFRITGQQIDGSFELNGATYLIEAKWENAPQGNTPLFAFEGKVDSKAAWSRGVFISYSGFSADGLIAFGSKKRTILIDGLDLHQALTSGKHIGEIIALKARRAVETGKPFIRFADL